MRNLVKQIFDDSIKIKEKTAECCSDSIIEAVNLIVRSIRKGGKLILFGNGGSAADSQHVAAELIGRFKKERKALAAVALTTNTSIMTALGNDYDFDIIFKRQIEGIASKGDVAFGISTSGNSKNVILGIEAAKKMGLVTITLTGNSGGKLAKLSDVSIVVPSADTPRIQESHICISHIICELVENAFAKK